MLITIHTVEDVADMIHKTNYGTWNKDYEACLALAKHMDWNGERLCAYRHCLYSQNQDELTVVNVREWVQRFAIFDDLDDLNNTYVPSEESIEKLSKKTTVISLSDGRFIAENF